MPIGVAWCGILWDDRKDRSILAAWLAIEYSSSRTAKYRSIRVNWKPISLFFDKPWMDYLFDSSDFLSVRLLLSRQLLCMIFISLTRTPRRQAKWQNVFTRFLFHWQFLTSMDGDLSTEYTRTYAWNEARACFPRDTLMEQLAACWIFWWNREFLWLLHFVLR